MPGLSAVYLSYKKLIPDSIPELGPYNDEMPELPIDLNQKKLYMIYESPVDDKYVDGPAQYQIPADFMLSLTPEQVPASEVDADYILLLKADYVEGNPYYSESGELLDITKLYSYTTVYLYDAKTLSCLGCLGTIKENPSNQIFYEYNNVKPYSYPTMVSVEDIYRLYSNVNTMSPYVLSGSIERDRVFTAGEEVHDNWKFVFDSFEAADSIQSRGTNYTSQTSGNKMVKVNLTFANVGPFKDTIIPMFSNMEENLNIYILDQQQNVYLAADMFSYSEGLSGQSIESGESISGSFVFDIPSAAVDSGLTLYIVKEPQRASCPLN